MPTSSTASIPVPAGVVVEPVGDLGRHPVGGGHLGRGLPEASGDAPQTESERVGALGVVADEGEASAPTLHRSQLEERQVLGLVDDHVAVGHGHSLDPGPDLVLEGAVAVGGQPGVDQVRGGAQLPERGAVPEADTKRRNLSLGPRTRIWPAVSRESL